MSILFCQKNNERILSPYNSIPGYELKDWTKSPDFGVINFKSNFPLKNWNFRSIGPSDGIDKFLWNDSKICIPFGTYRIKYNPKKKFYGTIDTLIVVERQKIKNIDFSLPLNDYSYLNYEKYNEFNSLTEFFRFIIQTGCGVFLPAIFDASSYGIKKSQIAPIFLIIFGTYLVNEELNRYYLNTINAYRKIKFKKSDNLKNGFSENNNMPHLLHSEPVYKQGVEFIPYDDAPYPINPIRPIYPEVAQEAGIVGVVLVQAFIDKMGIVKETNILKGIPNTGLDEAAVRAIRETKFEPAKYNKKYRSMDFNSYKLQFKIKNYPKTHDL